MNGEVQLFLLLPPCHVEQVPSHMCAGMMGSKLHLEDADHLLLCVVVQLLRAVCVLQRFHEGVWRGTAHTPQGSACMQQQVWEVHAAPAAVCNRIRAIPVPDGRGDDLGHEAMVVAQVCHLSSTAGHQQAVVDDETVQKDWMEAQKAVAQ